MPRPMHQENMEPEDDLSTPDPLDLLSDQGALPSTSSSLLSCTLLVQKDIPNSIFSICLFHKKWTLIPYLYLNGTVIVITCQNLIGFRLRKNLSTFYFSS